MTTIADIYAEMREVARDGIPDPSAPDVADRLARGLLAAGQRRYILALDHRVPPDPEMLTAECALFAALHLLMGLRETDTDAARRLSSEIAIAWEDGAGVGEHLWEHGRVLGVDTGEIARLANAEAGLRSADRDTLHDGCASTIAGLETDRDRARAKRDEARAVVREMHEHIASGDDYADPVKLAEWSRRAGTGDGQ